MIIITNIYHPNANTKQTVDSFQRHGYEVAINNAPFVGNGQVLRDMLACYRRAVTGHEDFFYTDGADTFCQRRAEPPKDYILYSTEKACYPHPELAKQYKPTKSKWKYLNGGGYGGPLKLIIEFFERYGLDKHANDVNGQHEQMVAFLKAEKEKFPIKLDTKCEVFQTMAFADPNEFNTIEETVIDNEKQEDRESGFVEIRKLLHNKLTKTIPAILHFNGLTDMSILKELK
jgi:hypothetical protein